LTKCVAERACSIVATTADGWPQIVRVLLQKGWKNVGTESQLQDSTIKLSATYYRGRWYATSHLMRNIKTV